jgi:hypothetical protein
MRTVMRRWITLATAVLALLVAAAPAGAFRLGRAPVPVAHTPPITWSTSRPIPRSTTPPRTVRRRPSGAGMQDFILYRACENEHGEIRRHMDPTTAHRNHIHFGLSKAGAMRRTSYWELG